MLLLDANVLLHAVNESATQHRLTKDYVATVLSQGEAVAFAWTVVLAFLRLSTHPSVFPAPLQPGQAVEVVGSWLAAPPAIALEPTARHLAVLQGLLGQTGVGGNLVSDAHLAALALEHGAAVITFDRDFARFDGLAVRQPS